MAETILVVDDESDIRRLISGLLEDEGYVLSQAANSDEVYAQLDSAPPSLIVLDIWLERSTHDGLQILKEVKARHPFIPIIMISGHSTIETAVSAIKDGAYDFIEKPFKSDRLILMVKRALEASALQVENKELRDNQVPAALKEANVVSLEAFVDTPLKDARAMFETEYLSAQLARFDGNVSKTAEFVGMERSALHRKMKSLNITMKEGVQNS